MTTADRPPARPDPVTGAITESLDAAGALDPDRPLYCSVDPDAIDRLHRHAATHGTWAEVAFEYEGHEVRVRVGREVEVAVDPSDGDAPSQRRAGAAD